MENFSSRGCGSFATPVNVYLVLAGIAGLVLNIFPLYVILKLQKKADRVGRDMLIAALCIIDILTILVPLSLNLEVKARCMDTSTPSGRPMICEIFFLMFIWLKLCAMFLITVLNYSSYLALNVKGQYSDRPSIGDRLSNSFHRAKSRTNRTDEHRRSAMVIAGIVLGIALVTFIISSLPYIDLGPKGEYDMNSNSTDILALKQEIQLCHLEQISFPLKVKEYTFLFAVLMSTAACLILHLVHSILSCFSCCFWRENLREAQELDIQMIGRNSDGGGLHSVQSVQSVTDSYARMTFALGVVYFSTWVPLMVRTYYFWGRLYEG